MTIVQDREGRWISDPPQDPKKLLRPPAGHFRAIQFDAWDSDWPHPIGEDTPSKEEAIQRVHMCGYPKFKCFGVYDATGVMVFPEAS